MKKSLFLSLLAVLAIGLLFVLAAPVFAQSNGDVPTDLPATVKIILGLLVPPLWQFVTRYVKNEKLMILVVGFLAVVTAFAAMFVYGIKITTLDFALAESLFFWSALAYKIIWKPLIDKWLPSLARN